MKSVQLISISPEELREEILKGTKALIEELKKELPKSVQPDYLTRSDVAKMLQIDLSTLYHWTKKGKLTAYGIGGRVYYKRDEVESAIIKIN